MMALVAALVAAPAAEAQRPPAQQRQQRGMMERPGDRAALEAQVMERFLQTAAQRMGLEDAGRERLQQVLRRSAGERRTMHQASEALQTRLQEAVRTGAPDAQVRSVLEELTALRRQELQLWEREQRELAEFLTPRQHAMYMVQWMRLQESIRGIMGRRQGGPPPPLIP